jgi:hypothetical protein
MDMKECEVIYRIKMLSLHELCIFSTSYKEIEDVFEITYFIIDFAFILTYHVTSLNLKFVVGCQKLDCRIYNENSSLINIRIS